MVLLLISKICLKDCCFWTFFCHFHVTNEVLHQKQTKVDLEIIYKKSRIITSRNLEIEDTNIMICSSEVVKLSSESKRKFLQYVKEPAHDHHHSKDNMDHVSKLKKKLMHLERETQIMKNELLHDVQQKKSLLNDVYRQLKLLQFSLHHEKQNFEYEFRKKQEGGRSDGLSQVLYEDWNPSVVIRGGSRANSVVTSCTAESTMSNTLCIEYNS